MTRRPHIIYITSERWKDKALVDRIRKHARKMAGENPGLLIVIKKEISVQSFPTQYLSTGRTSKTKCANCMQSRAKHILGVDCPTKTYWEQVATYQNLSKGVLRWR